MSLDFIRKLCLFVLFVLVQTLVLNHVHLFNVATPLLYVYFVVMFSNSYPRWAVLLWSFAMGLSIDTFSNTPGMAAASLTLVGVLQPYILTPFIPRDSGDNFSPSISSLGFTKFFYYLLALVFIFCVSFFSLEMLNFFNWLYWVECVFGSMALTVILILVLENLRGKS